MSSQSLEALLRPHAMSDTSSANLQNQGWIAPRENGGLVHSVAQQYLLLYAHEKKLLPASVVNQFSKVRASELEQQQGFAPGRKHMKEIKEQVTEELLPRAFSIQRSTALWIDPKNGWLVIDSATAAKADEVIKLLIESIPDFPLRALRVQQSALTAMTQWLAANEAPYNFSVDQDTELRATGENRATVRYVHHTLEAEEIKQHIASGKQCTRLALTWASRISFVLTESLTIKRVKALDILKETDGNAGLQDEERFDADMVLMTSELRNLISDLVEALGGQVPDQIAA